MPAKKKTSSEGDLWAGSFDLGVKMWGRGPAPRDPHRLLWLSGRIRSRLSAGRPVSGQVPGNGERARWVAARLRVQGCSSEARAQRAPPARMRPPAEPRASPESGGHRAAAARQGHHADDPLARSRPGAPRESQAASQKPRRTGARERCGHRLAVPPRAHRHCPAPYRSCSPVTRTSAMRSSSLC